MKIVWISHSSRLEGADRVLLEAVTSLRDLRQDLHVVLPRRGLLENSLRELDVPCTLIPQPWWLDFPSERQRGFRRKLLRRLARATRDTRAFLREIAADVVISNTLVAPAGAFAARLMGIRHLWYVHEVGDLDHGMSFVFGRTPTLFLLRALSEKVLVNSEFVRRALFGSSPNGKIALVPYAVDIGELGPPVPDVHGPVHEQGPRPVRLLMLGRMSPQKGQLDAIRAVERLVKGEGCGDVVLDLVGERNEYVQRVLGPYVEGHELAAYVRFHPFTRHPIGHYLQADVVLVCSRAEAFGRVTVEAMKLGLPVVAADSGASPEIVENSITGLLYRSGDVEDLTAKIARYSRDADLRQAHGRNARVRATERFTKERFREALSVAVLGRPPGHRPA